MPRRARRVVVFGRSACGSRLPSEGESLALTLEPRPTLLLLLAPSVLRGFPSDAWNTVVPTEDVSDLRSTVTRLIPRNQLPDLSGLDPR
ncbi:MAG: hypothetical protein U0V87_00595 [Acidobacteriota bacterium]